MKHRYGDIPYLGCRQDKIQTAVPQINTINFVHLCNWIKERYTVHLKKDIMHMPAPWTDDPIIREFRFTNVRREHDKETKWVIENLCRKSPEEFEGNLIGKWANLILFRIFNKSETCKHILPIDFDNVNWNKINAYFNSCPKDYVFFTNAFNTGGVKRVCNWKTGENDPKTTAIKYIQNLFDQGEFECLDTVRADDFFNNLVRIPGMGRFLAYQILVDWTYCPECPFSENEFVIAGPGCKKGLEMIFTYADGMTLEEQLFWLRDNWNKLLAWLNIDWTPEELFTDLPKEDRFMNVMSLENCMCELSKYIRAYNGTGRPRNKYNPGGNKNDK